ncbi:MAG TPA: DUF4173 domain-containing protein [Gaiellaceae bacterium]|jgi:hypothetical protein
MSREKRLGLALLAAAVVLGVLGDLVFYGRPLGVNVALFALAFVGALAVLLRVGRAPFHQGRRWMALPLLVFAFAFLWHTSPLLVATNLLAIAGAVTLGALRRTQPSPVRAEVGEYAAAGASAGFGAFGGAVHLLHKDVPWPEMQDALRGTRSASIARGVAIGVPLVVLFGGLFVAADSVFQRLVSSAVPSVPHLGTHLLLACAIAWPAAGLLRDLVASREDARLLPADRLLARRFSLGAMEVAIALGALVVLFALFVAVQARYFFGGSALVEAREHLSYATYARHGFFELVAVSALVLVVVVGANALVRSRVVRVLSAVLVALELVVAVSALQRLRLYEHEYGLTELRVWTTGVVLWLMCVFVWLCCTTLRGRGRFAVGALVLGFAATAALNVVSPDALIARTNLSRPHIDVAYLSRLSDDAVPTLVSRLPSLRPDLRADLARRLLSRSEARGGVLGWNASRSRAQAVLREHRAELERFARSR